MGRLLRHEGCYDSDLVKARMTHSRNTGTPQSWISLRCTCKRQFWMWRAFVAKALLTSGMQAWLVGGDLSTLPEGVCLDSYLQDTVGL